MHILLVQHQDDPGLPGLYGPFDYVEQAQEFAERFRELNGLPREATSDNNEEWTEAGWYFGIWEPTTKMPRTTTVRIRNDEPMWVRYYMTVEVPSSLSDEDAEERALELVRDGEYVLESGPDPHVSMEHMDQEFEVVEVQR